MTGESVDIPALLLELSAIPPANRAARLHAFGPADRLLLELGDQTERMATIDAGQAVSLATLVVDLADEIGPARPRARARRALAQTLAYTGRFPEAMSRCEEAVAIAETAGETVEAARARLASLHALASLGRFEEALTAGETARQAFLDAGQPFLAARADLNLGAVQAMHDAPHAALVYFDRARPLLNAEPILLAQLETNRGNALMSLDDFTGAETAFEAAIAAFTTGGQRHAAAIAEGNLAYLATRQGLLAPALAHYERARRSLESDDSQAHLARLLAEQAAAVAVLGLPADALAAHLDLIPTLDALGLAVESARARATLGRILLRLGRLHDAEETLNDAALRFDELGQPVGRGSVEVLRAELRLADGRLDEARELAESALAAFDDRPAERATVLALLVRIALARDDLLGADDLLRQGLTIAGAYALSPVLADLHHSRGRLASRRGDLATAREAFRTAIDHVEQIRGMLQAERFRAAYLGNRLAVYTDLALAALATDTLDGIAEAFATIERSKSRALLDVVGGSFALDSFGPADTSEAPLIARLEQRRAELNWHYSRLVASGPGAPPHDSAWQQTVRAAEEEYRQLQERLATTRGVRDPVSRPVDLAEVLAAIPESTAMIAYVVAGSEVAAFVLRSGVARVFRHMASIDEVTDRLRRFRFQIARALAGHAHAGPRAERLLADSRRELGALYGQLLEPLRDAIAGAEHLAVVPHGPLHAVPFHALWDGERYQIERTSLIAAPSASLLVHLGSSLPATERKLHAVVVSVPDELTPGIPVEADRVAAALQTPARLHGPEATADRFAAVAAGAATIHFAGHGRFSAADPASSGLKLADRWFTPRDLAALRLPGAHVTLSGCDTGQAEVSAGDELFGLVRGLLSAGAASLLVSLWPAHDEGTAGVMADFYYRRQSGTEIATAWSLAQRAAIDRHPHPAVWAPFLLLKGLSRPTDSSRQERSE